jgi:hypothetical protein
LTHIVLPLGYAQKVCKIGTLIDNPDNAHTATHVVIPDWNKQMLASYELLLGVCIAPNIVSSKWLEVVHDDMLDPWWGIYTYC